MCSAAPGYEIKYSVVLVPLVVVDVSIEDHKSRPGLLLFFFQECGKANFLFSRGVPAAVRFLIGRTGVRGEMKYKEYEINIRSEMIDLAVQPLSLRPGEFVERAIQDQHQGVSNPHGVESASFDRRETRKVVSQRCFLVAMEVVIS